MISKKELHFRFWSEFRKYVINNGWALNVNPMPQEKYYYDIRFGQSGLHLSLHSKIDQGMIYTGVYINNEKEDAYLKLLTHKKEMESILGEINWGKTEKGVFRLKQFFELDITDERNWELAFNWLGVRSYVFQEVVKLYLKT